MKNYKILFSSTLIMGTLIALSSQSWMSMWMGMEINLLSIIPMMSESNKNSTESSIKYFITQAMASSGLLMSLIIMMMNTMMISKNEESWLQMAMNSMLLTKMGMTPFHFWFPEVMEGLSWMNCLIMMTWQKLAPMVLIMNNFMFPVFMSMIVLMGMIFSGMMSFNQVSLRKLLTYSSINHMSWMVSVMMYSQTIWMIYFITYSIMSSNLIFVLIKKKTNKLNNITQIMNSNPQMKLIFMLNMLNMSGLPPFMGFFPKWLIIQYLASLNMKLLMISMVILTLFMIFIYMKICMTSLIISTNQMKWNLIKSNSMSMIISLFNFLNLSMLILFTMMFSFN